MSESTLQLLTEIIKALPSLLFYSILGILLWKLYKPFVNQLLPKLTNFKAFGIEIGFIKQELKQASINYGVEFNDGKGQALIKRLEHYDTKRNVKILWIDDNPNSNQYENRILKEFRIISEFASSSEQARKYLTSGVYDIVISDIKRKDNPSEGVEFLKQLELENVPYPPFIFNIGNLNPDLGTPPYAFGITNNPVELLHLVLDVLDRKVS